MDGRKGDSSPLYSLVLLVAKAARTYGIYLVFHLLHHYGFPVLYYAFVVISGSALAYLALYRPLNAKKEVNARQWLKLWYFGLLQGLAVISWHVALSYLGPLRTILMGDYAELAFFYISSASGRRTLRGNKLAGLVVLLASYVALMWAPGLPKAPNDGISLSFVSLGPRITAFLALAFYAFLTTLRQGVSRRLSQELGSARRVFALGSCLAPIIISPCLLYFFFVSPLVVEAPSIWTIFYYFSVGIVTVSVGNYGIETAVAQHVPASTISTLSFVASFLFANVWEALSDQYTISVAMWVGYGLVLLGSYLLVGSDEDAEAVARLPLFSGSLSGEQRSRNYYHTLRLILRQILANSDSKRIFFFLCINLCFMFVEMLYGVWTNSLGLISDACHMLFDCTALGIGLYAAVISKWDATKVFSYGYGRVQVLSGFVNAIFLMFIAFFVLMESIERFLEPQEIKTERLLLVSTLGLCVNLIGVFAFHSHSHGHGGDEEAGEEEEHHEHNHAGGDHGHSHAHEKHKSKKKHSHSHGHSHGGDDNLTGVYLHVLADTLGSVGVITSSALVHYFGWTIADPVCSFCISMLIFFSVIPLLRSSAGTLLQCTPRTLEPAMPALLNELHALDGVLACRDVHVWSHSSAVCVATAHVLVRADVEEQKMLATLSHIFKKRLHVTYLTVQIEKEGLNPATGLSLGVLSPVQSPTITL